MGEHRNREVFDGWMSPRSRTVMLGVGWALVLASLLAALIGLFAGVPVLSVVGALTGFVAWTVSSIMPEPLPAPRKTDRRRIETLSRIGGHQLPT